VTLKEGKAAQRWGIFLSLVANSVWGAAALYWMETKPVAPIDVLAHRATWTLPAALLVILVAGRLGSTFSFLRNWRVLRVMGLAAFLISINWGVFLYAVTTGRATEASLGYFLLPILTVFAGVIIFRERPSTPQRIAIGMAIAGIAIQVVAEGGIPVVSLALAISFALYSVIRKQVSVDAMEGLFLESLFLFPAGLAWLMLHQWAGLGQFGLKTDFFLLFAGAFTAIPLLTHITASRLLPLSTIGLLSYIGPTLQLLVAQTLLGESITLMTFMSFVFVWCGLGFIIQDNIRSYRKIRKAGMQ
jgi:chloramphenicol-sensitive protein RarD